MDAIVDACLTEIAGAIQEIQQPRTDFELRHFVVGQHDTAPRQYAQCVLEMQIKLQGLRRADVRKRQIRRRIDALRARNTPASMDKAELLELDLHEQELACVGAKRELAALLTMFRGFPRQYSREELNDADQSYWVQRLTRQANQDIVATGRIGTGNLEALRQVGLPCAPSCDYIRAVERRFLEKGDVRVAVVVPTLESQDNIQASGLRCLSGWDIPGTFQHAVHVVTGRGTADAYNVGVEWALAQDSHFVLCVEDDHIIPSGAFEQLWNLFLKHGPRAIVGAWYPQKQTPRVGAAIILRNGVREFLSDDGNVHEVFAITQGFTLIPTAAFHAVPRPWFATTGALTQDSFFSQAARDAGFKLFVDTSLRCGHVDRRTGQVFE